DDPDRQDRGLEERDGLLPVVLEYFEIGLLEVQHDPVLAVGHRGRQRHELRAGRKRRAVGCLSDTGHAQKRDASTGAFDESFVDHEQTQVAKAVPYKACEKWPSVPTKG